jgi:hypothetical protein
MRLAMERRRFKSRVSQMLTPSTPDPFRAGTSKEVGSRGRVHSGKVVVATYRFPSSASLKTPDPVRAAESDVTAARCKSGKSSFPNSPHRLATDASGASG